MTGPTDPRTPGTVRAVIFDFDGVLIDSEYEVATAAIEILAAQGAKVGMGDIGHLFGSTDLDHEWEALLHRHLGGRLTLAALEQELASFLPARLEVLPLMAGAGELLSAFAESGLALGLATGTEPPRLHQHLNRLGIRDRFDVIVTRSEVPRGKPHPDIYLAAASRLGVEPGACVAIEDSIPGCHSALAAGMPVVVCPSRVSAGCEFPSAARRVECLTEIDPARLGT